MVALFTDSFLVFQTIGYFQRSIYSRTIADSNIFEGYGVDAIFIQAFSAKTCWYPQDRNTTHGCCSWRFNRACTQVCCLIQLSFPIDDCPKFSLFIRDAKVIHSMLMEKLQTKKREAYANKIASGSESGFMTILVPNSATGLQGWKLPSLVRKSISVAFFPQFTNIR